MPSGAERARLRHASKRVLIGMVDGAIEIASSSTATTVTRRRRCSRKMPRVCNACGKGTIAPESENEKPRNSRDLSVTWWSVGGIEPWHQIVPGIRIFVEKRGNDSSVPLEGARVISCGIVDERILAKERRPAQARRRE